MIDNNKGTHLSFSELHYSMFEFTTLLLLLLYAKSLSAHP